MPILLPFKVSITGGQGNVRHRHIIAQEEIRFFGLIVPRGLALCKRFPAGGKGRIAQTSPALFRRTVETKQAGRTFCPLCLRTAERAELQLFWSLGAEELKIEEGFAWCLSCRKRDLAERVEQGDCINCNPPDIPF